MVDAVPDHDAPERPAENSSSWAINWNGLVMVVLIATVGIIGWRSLDGTTFGQGEPADDLETSAASVPATTEADESRAASDTAPTTTRPTLPPSTTTTTTASEPRVIISGEMRPCEYGSNCLVASFTIEGFDDHPGRFVCIYPNSRSDFGFGSNGVDDACLTGDAGDTITIEAGGVRSATISERNLGGVSQDDE